jgi:hypothetical protein
MGRALDRERIGADLHRQSATAVELDQVAAARFSDDRAAAEQMVIDAIARTQ